MRRVQYWVIFTLLSIVIIAIILRLIKLYEFSVWGSDSGEHYYLLNQIIDSGQIQLDYNGWGLAYPYFPGMHLVSSGFAELSSTSTYQALIYTIPIIASLSVLLIFCIAFRTFRDHRIALFSAGFLAVILPHVYTTSHPMPGSLGSFLLLACIFLLFKSYDNLKFIFLLVLTTIALIITHHLSTYFLIIALISIILFRELLQYPKDRLRTQLDFGYLSFLIIASLIYWMAYAIPFRDKILLRGIPLPIWLFILLAIIGLGILNLVIYMRRKFKWQYIPKFYNVKNLELRILLLIIGSILILFISTITGVPGTDMKTDSQIIIIFLPIIILFSFLAISPAVSIYYKDGISVFAWLIAICFSIIFSFITNSQELLIYRHIPYAFESMSILAGLGLVKLFDIIINKRDTEFIITEPNRELINPKIIKDQPINDRLKKKSKNYLIHPPDVSPKNLSRWPQLAVGGCVIILLVICGIYSYPPLEVVSGFEEGTTNEELEACLWAKEHVEDGSTLASDHRMSSMMFGFAKINSSWEYAPKTIHGESFVEMQDEVDGVNIPAGEKRIDYVLITDAIINGVTLVQWEPAEPMSEHAIQKFQTKPFIKLYDNGDAQLYNIRGID
jgi:hypothetical protein